VRKIVIGVAATITSLAVVGVAFAGSSTLLSGYAGVGGQTQHMVGGSQQVLGAAATRSGTLPFTGLDLALVALGAVVLMAMGWSLRRAARKQS
jgi:hypothetical protein